MKKFIIKLLTFSFTLLCLFTLLLSNADGFTDPYYLRFTSPKQKSLILGTSKSAQGLQPDVFESILNERIFNYSFTLEHSPYGKTYFNSIKRKTLTSSKDGIFIVTVDPWSISSFTKKPNDSLSFRELELPLANTPIVNLNPNLLYFVNNWNHKYYKLLRDNSSKLFLHDNGWLEVNVTIDSLEVSKKIENKVIMYREKYLSKAHFSINRFNYFKKTINFLKSHGEVYLIRLPIHSEIMKIENELMPSFDNLIEGISSTTNGYLDLTSKNSDFTYTDGNHLHKKSGKVVSEIIASWICDLKNKSSTNN